MVTQCRHDYRRGWVGPSIPSISLIKEVDTHAPVRCTTGVLSGMPGLRLAIDYGDCPSGRRDPHAFGAPSSVGESCRRRLLWDSFSTRHRNHRVFEGTSRVMWRRPHPGTGLCPIHTKHMSQRGRRVTAHGVAPVHSVGYRLVWIRSSRIQSTRKSKGGEQRQDKTKHRTLDAFAASVSNKPLAPVQGSCFRPSLCVSACPEHELSALCSVHARLASMIS